MKSTSVVLHHTRDTKGTRLYREADDARDVVYQVYLQKAVAEKLGNPDSIKVTVEAA